MRNGNILLSLILFEIFITPPDKKSTRHPLESEENRLELMSAMKEAGKEAASQMAKRDPKETTLLRSMRREGNTLIFPVPTTQDEYDRINDVACEKLGVESVHTTVIRRGETNYLKASPRLRPIKLV